MTAAKMRKYLRQFSVEKKKRKNFDLFGRTVLYISIEYHI